MTPLRSASGAREGGDDFQHLVAWSRILGALPDERGLRTVEVEALDVGNVDDVVLRAKNQPDEFSQVRYGVDLAHPIDLQYLTKAKGNGTSLLSKFYRSWQQLGGSEERPHIQLITNKLADPTDLLMRSVDGRTSTLGPPLRAATAASGLVTVRGQLAQHLGVDEPVLLQLLDDLRLRLGCHYQNEQDHAATLMLASGMHHDVNAVRRGIDLVRQWVLGGRRALDADEVRQQIADADLIAEGSWATLLIQAIDHDPHAGDASIALDLVENYDGASPAARRRVHAGAYEEMHDAILSAAARLRANGKRRVMVSGAMRLATWFAAGAALSEVAGHTLMCGHPSQRWVSNDKAAALPVVVEHRTIGAGTGLAVAVAFATDPTDDVTAAVHEAGLPVSTIVTISPPNGVRIADGRDANDYAAAIKQTIRRELRDQGGDQVHLFLAAPAGLALLLGHTWNRVAPTTVWEDIGIGGYERAYSVAG